MDATTNLPVPREAALSVESPEGFLASLAPIIGAEAKELSLQSRLVTDLKLGDASILYVVLLLREVNPFFDIPEQCDVRDLTVLDLWHHVQNMTSEHWDDLE